MKVLIVGDVHGRFSHLNAALAKTQPELCIILGEMGIWPNVNFMDMKTIKSDICPVWFIPGNHEDYYYLNRITSDEILPNIFYKPRGSVESINGKTCVFLGGGFSIDYKYRTVGWDYFPDDELLTYADIEKIPDDLVVDIVFSHTCPNAFTILSKDRERQFPDSSRVVLDKVLKKYQPVTWYFGHWHVYKEGVYRHKSGVTRWTCMNKIESPNGYKAVEI
jgi:Icc-related predicted phosphoesterase